MPAHDTARCLTVLLYCARWRALRNPSPACVHSVQLDVLLRIPNTLAPNWASGVVTPMLAVPPGQCHRSPRYEFATIMALDSSYTLGQAWLGSVNANRRSGFGFVWLGHPLRRSPRWGGVRAYVSLAGPAHVHEGGGIVEEICQHTHP